MLREFITFPVRAGLFATRLGLRLTGDALGVAVRSTERLIEVVAPQAPARATRGSKTIEVEVLVAPPQPTRSWSRRERPVGDRVPAAAVPRPAVAPTVTEDETRPEPAPVHISTEPELVEAFAEPGAEEGAGAAVHIEEPWRGFAQMSANDVIARLGEASPEELAVVELYEGMHRRRKTVLAAAEKGLRRRPAAYADSVG